MICIGTTKCTSEKGLLSSNCLNIDNLLSCPEMCEDWLEFLMKMLNALSTTFQLKVSFVSQNIS